jgi:hypothetical protein
MRATKFLKCPSEKWLSAGKPYLFNSKPFDYTHHPCDLFKAQNFFPSEKLIVFPLRHTKLTSKVAPVCYLKPAGPLALFQVGLLALFKI